MKIEALAPILLPFFALPLVRCWGTLGHQTVAYIATNLVASSTTTFFQALLGDTTESYLAGVATWADSYRYTKEGRFSAPLHFIDADNDPPESCGVVYQRDCAAEGCVVGAISSKWFCFFCHVLDDLDVHSVLFVLKRLQSTCRLGCENDAQRMSSFDGTSALTATLGGHGGAWVFESFKVTRTITSLIRSLFQESDSVEAHNSGCCLEV